MRIVAVIPVKLSSERVPGKNIKRFFDGKPLMHFIQEACLHSKRIDEVYVYCSSDEIVEYVLEGVAFLKRPEQLDSDCANGNDIIRTFMHQVDADVYVMAHATGPFTKPSSIDKCIEAVCDLGYDSAFLAKRMQEFLWQGGVPLNFDVQHFPRTQDLEPIYCEASGAFVFTKEVFQKYDRRVGVKPYIHEVDDIEAVDIDYPIDFTIADAIYKEIVKNERYD